MKNKFFDFAYEAACWAGVAAVFLLFWLIFGFGYEPTVFFAE